MVLINTVQIFKCLSFKGVMNISTNPNGAVAKQGHFLEVTLIRLQILRAIFIIKLFATDQLILLIPDRTAATAQVHLHVTDRLYKILFRRLLPYLFLFVE